MRLAKTKALISCAVNAQLSCIFVFARNAKIRFPDDATHLINAVPRMDVPNSMFDTEFEAKFIDTEQTELADWCLFSFTRYYAISHNYASFLAIRPCTMLLAIMSQNNINIVMNIPKVHKILYCIRLVCRPKQASQFTLWNTKTAIC